MITKTCSTCHTEKALSEFYKRYDRAHGYQTSCKPCALDKKRAWRKNNPEKAATSQRRNDLKKNYGITPEDYDRLLQEQGGSCAICKATSQKGGRFNSFCVDHDHTTGKVRGLLCYDCNFGIGKFNDNISTLESAILYLRQQ